MKIMMSNEIEQLESVVDKYGIDTLFNVISMICSEKAEHVATNHQDYALANRWQYLAGCVDKLTPKAEGL